MKRLLLALVAALTVMPLVGQTITNEIDAFTGEAKIITSEVWLARKQSGFVPSELFYGSLTRLDGRECVLINFKSAGEIQVHKGDKLLILLSSGKALTFYANDDYNSWQEGLSVYGSKAFYDIDRGTIEMLRNDPITKVRYYYNSKATSGYNEYDVIPRIAKQFAKCADLFLSAVADIEPPTPLAIEPSAETND